MIKKNTLGLRRGALTVLGAAVLGAAAMSACSSSDDTSTSNGGSGGSVGGSHTGGTAGKGGTSATAGSGGKGGTSASGGTGGSIVVGGSGGAIGSAGEAGETSAAGAAGAPGTPSVEQHVTKTLLTSDQAGAAHTVANLVNAWGLAINPNAQGGPLFWVSATDSGVSDVFDATGNAPGLVVTVPAGTATGLGAGTGAPTGQAYNASATAFNGDTFIFATEDGFIEGWKTGTVAVAEVNNFTTASYKGLAIATVGATPELLATNFKAGAIDSFTSAFAAITTKPFNDATIPAGFAPFNVAELNGKVYVTYAKQDADKADDVKAVGNGYVNVFNLDGTLDKRLISQGALNSPWGIALAPAGWGGLAGALLVGNFGDGLIHAYDATSGEMVGELTDAAGTPLAIDGLWALAFGPNVASGDLSAQLFFTAGPARETHGQFGKLVVAP